MATQAPPSPSSVWGWLPWVLFFALSRVGLPAAGVIAGLLVALYTTVIRAVRGLSVKLPDWVTLAFFAIATLSVLVDGSALLLFWKYSLVVLWGLFAGMAWASILLGAPFTLQYARESTPPEFWQHPVFVRTGRILTLVWAGVFTLNLAITGAAVGPKSPPWFAILLPMLTVAGAFVFTTRYAAAVSRRAAAAFPQASR
jgi:hypothetical protein